MKETFGILAAVVGISGAVPYIYTILRGSTRPHRVTWAIWATLGSITLTSYLAKGARWSALLAFAAAFNNILIFFISLKYGVGGSSRGDRLALALGALGIAAWVLTREATYALLFAIFADSVGTYLTVRKSYKSPRSESAVTWTMASIASLFGLLAVQSYNFAQTVYPVYALVGGSTLMITILARRAQKTKE